MPRALVDRVVDRDDARDRGRQFFWVRGCLLAHHRTVELRFGRVDPVAAGAGAGLGFGVGGDRWCWVGGGGGGGRGGERVGAWDCGDLTLVRQRAECAWLVVLRRSKFGGGLGWERLVDAIG